LAAKTFDGTAVRNKYEPGQWAFVLSAEPGGFPAHFFIDFGQYFFRCLSVTQNTQQETEEQTVRCFEKETVSSFIASRNPWK
jgi:hypothetical protein